MSKIPRIFLVLIAIIAGIYISYLLMRYTNSFLHDNYLEGNSITFKSNNHWTIFVTPHEGAAVTITAGAKSEFCLIEADLGAINWEKSDPCASEQPDGKYTQSMVLDRSAKIALTDKNLYEIAGDYNLRLVSNETFRVDQKPTTLTIVFSWLATLLGFLLIGISTFCVAAIADAVGEGIENFLIQTAQKRREKREASKKRKRGTIEDCLP